MCVTYMHLAQRHAGLYSNICSSPEECAFSQMPVSELS